MLRPFEPQPFRVTQKASGESGPDRLDADLGISGPPEATARAHFQRRVGPGWAEEVSARM